MNYFLPKLWICFREGISRTILLNDILAGITVGIVALPLAMAIGIASIPETVALQAGISPPAAGLYTAIIAGFLISFLGGSRVQIGGPTGAFIVIVYGVALKHGYSGLLMATIMAGVILILMGLFRFGAIIKYIPFPVTTGFTSGIAVIIFTSQIKDALGLKISNIPPDFIGKCLIFYHHIPETNFYALFISLGTLGCLICLRRFLPRIPGTILVVILFSILTVVFKLPVDTIESRFGTIPSGISLPRVPHFSWSIFRDVLPDAFTIAILAGIESLLSAVVADGMTGFRHKSDTELIAQGVANIGSAFFGGIPATGAIARTATNVKTGARTPIAGITHALVLLVFILLFSKWVKFIPMATLASILILIAWNMSERDHFRFILKAPRNDIIVLLMTFSLTVFMDLTIAVGIGVVLAAMLFMKRMADVSQIAVVSGDLGSIEDDRDELSRKKDPFALEKWKIPKGVEVFEIEGPFFFGVADRLKDTLNFIDKRPQIFVLRMRKVPVIDATGLFALHEFYKKCHRQGIVLILSGVQPGPMEILRKRGMDKEIGINNITPDLGHAIARISEILKLDS